MGCISSSVIMSLYDTQKTFQVNTSQVPPLRHTWLGNQVLRIRTSVLQKR